MKRLLSVLSLCLLTACAGLPGGLGQKDLGTWLNTGYTSYLLICASDPASSWCTADAEDKAADADRTAKKTIQSFKDGKINYAEAEKAVKAAFKLFADFQG